MRLRGLWPGGPGIAGTGRLRQAVSIARTWLGRHPDTGLAFLPPRHPRRTTLDMYTHATADEDSRRRVLGAFAAFSLPLDHEAVVTDTATEEGEAR